jgi:hypothetical protein
LKTRALATGALTWVPGFSRFANRSTGGTAQERYCYSVWMRHLCVVGTRSALRARRVAEFGPGDSMGIGLAAMLSGADRYFAFDRKAFANPRTNLAVLEGLLELFRTRAPIPDDSEFPGVFPKLESYAFPTGLLDEVWLARCLAPDRVESIRRAVSAEPPRAGESVKVRYFAPWNAEAAILPDSVDWIFSQAVLEHVDDVRGAYASLFKWLRPGGLMSHAIDYSCHGLTRDWNGHWTIPDGLWSVVRGRRAYLINRLPHSAHIEAMRECGFRIVTELRSCGTTLPRSDLASGYREMSDEDLATSGAFVIAVKP